MFTLGEANDMYVRGEIKPYTYIPVLGEDKPILVNGLCSLIYAAPKVGKTEFLMQTLLRIVGGKRGPRKVVWYTEEYDTNIWGNRIGALNPLSPHEALQAPEIQLRDGWSIDINEDVNKLLSVDRLRFLKQIEWNDIPTDVPITPTIVVVDTIKLLRIENENDSAQIRRAIEPLYSLAKELKFTLLLVHHARKQAGMFGQNAAGGYDFMGAVDVVIELSRTDKKDARRRLSVIGGRGVEEVDYEYIMNESRRLEWVSIQTNNLVDVLRDNEGIAMSGPDLRNRLGMTDSPMDQKKFERMTEHPNVYTVGQKRGKRYTFVEA